MVVQGCFIRERMWERRSGWKTGDVLRRKTSWCEEEKMWFFSKSKKELGRKTGSLFLREKQRVWWGQLGRKQDKERFLRGKNKVLEAKHAWLERRHPRERWWTKMKYNSRVSSSRQKSQKAHFTVSSSVQRVLMRAPFSTALRSKYNARSMPIRKDEVLVVRGTFKSRERKVIQVYRQKWVVHVERITREKIPTSFPYSRSTPLQINLVQLMQESYSRIWWKCGMH